MQDEFEGKYEPDLEMPEPMWKKYPLRNKKGEPIECDHPSCGRWAVRTLGSDQCPKNHEIQFIHDCCSVHSRGPFPMKDQEDARVPED